MDPNSSSPAPTSSTSTLIMTPATSTRSSTATHHASQPPPPPLTIPQGPLLVTALSRNSWRAGYPQVGQFAMTESEEVVAAGPSGLFYFKRIRGHCSTPWSEPRPLPNTPATLNSFSVSGLAIHSSELRLDVYCVSGGVLHNFYRSDEDSSPFVVNPHPPLSNSGFIVSGTPAVATTHDGNCNPQRCNLVVPCLSGGLLHTSMSSGSRYWEQVDHIATNLGVISAASIVAAPKKLGLSLNDKDIVVVCVACARLYTVEGNFADKSGYSSRWKAQTPTIIHHPGGVTGNPVLATKAWKNQLDLLVPLAEGGVFHFV